MHLNVKKLIIKQPFENVFHFTNAFTLELSSRVSSTSTNPLQRTYYIPTLLIYFGKINEPLEGETKARLLIKCKSSALERIPTRVWRLD